MDNTDMATTVLQAKFSTNRPGSDSRIKCRHRPIQRRIASPNNSSVILVLFALAAITLVVTWAGINALSSLLMELGRYTADDYLTAVSGSNLRAAPLLPK